MFHQTCRIDLKLNNQTQHSTDISVERFMLHILRWVLIFKHFDTPQFPGRRGAGFDTPKSV